MLLAALFLFLYSIILTLSPAVKLRSWNVEYRWVHWIGFLVWLGGAIITQRKSIKYIPDSDPYLLPVAMLLSGWGLLTIFRLDTYFGLRQSVWFLAAMAVFFIFLRIPDFLQLLRRYKYILLISGLFLMVLTLIIGIYPGGSGPQLWLKIGMIYIQPSEPIKLLLVIYLSAYLADKLSMQLSLIKLITPTLVIIGAAAGILLVQRDLGTASIIILLYFLVTYLASGKKEILWIAALSLVLAAIVGYLIFPVIQLRVDSWINPWLDPSRNSYQIVQSLLATAAGGVFGRGIGIGNPGVVPIAHSDFIFAAISEEMGLTGTIGLIFLFSLLVSRGVNIALKAQTSYLRFLAGGITTYLILQSILIIGGNIRMLPLTGVTLPFVSYGGSSLVISIISLLILSLISSQPNHEPVILPNPKPILVISTLLMAGLACLTLVNGWWSLVRSNDLLTHMDNPRRSISDLYVERGNILDRDNNALSYTSGEKGDYQRVLTLTSLSPVIGFNDYYFGQAGLEASLDPYLRGIKGNPSSLIWYNFIVYGQPPQGLDVRISIDSGLQELADSLLPETPSALVLINAETGEIISLASHPYIDPELLQENWEEWNNDEDSPFLNRVTQGQYPVGTTFTPFLLPYILSEQESLPSSPLYLSYSVNGEIRNCSLTVDNPDDWNEILSKGCPGAFIQLAGQVSNEDLNELYSQFGFTSRPVISLPAAEPEEITYITDSSTLMTSQDYFISPLQLVLASAVFSTDGDFPQPVLDMAVNTPQQGWVILSSENKTSLYSSDIIEKSLDYLSNDNPLIWQVSSQSYTEETVISWFSAGTTSEWQGSPLAVVVMLESDNAKKVAEIGINILQATMNP